MTLQNRKIKINDDLSINLKEQTLFLANGDEGLHLWEASIILSRYIIKHKELFDNKEVIELGSGCGLLGIASLLNTNLKHFCFSDYQDLVINNLIDNIKLNKLDHQHFKREKDSKDKSNCLGCLPDKYSFLKLDWRDYDNYKLERYDYVIGCELVYDGGYLEELSKLIFNLLAPSKII